MKPRNPKYTTDEEHGAQPKKVPRWAAPSYELEEAKPPRFERAYRRLWPGCRVLELRFDTKAQLREAAMDNGDEHETDGSGPACERAPCDKDNLAGAEGTKAHLGDLRDVG